jgi:hypothetical protein
MRAIAKRLSQLENRVVSAAKPLRCLRIRAMLVGSRPTLKGAQCTRMLCADGSVLETVKYGIGDRDAAEITAEEEDRWVKTFPVEDLRPRHAASVANSRLGVTQ